MSLEDALLIDRLIDATNKGMIEWVDHRDVSMVGFLPPRPNSRIVFELYPRGELCLIVDDRNLGLIDLTGHNGLSLWDGMHALIDLVVRHSDDPEVARRLRVEQTSTIVQEALDQETRDAHPSDT